MKLRTHKGSTLIVTLLLLLVISLLGVSSMQTAQMQQKMSSNIQDKEYSFNAAESALSAGEAWLLGLTAEPNVFESCAVYPCVQEVMQNVNLVQQDDEWWSSHAASYDGGFKKFSTPPKYIVEFLQFVPDSPIIGDSSMKSKGMHYYQITAYGVGASSEATTILQTTIARRF